MSAAHKKAFKDDFFYILYIYISSSTSIESVMQPLGNSIRSEELVS